MTRRNTGFCCEKALLAGLASICVTLSVNACAATCDGRLNLYLPSISCGTELVFKKLSVGVPCYLRCSLCSVPLETFF